MEKRSLPAEEGDELVALTEQFHGVVEELAKVVGGLNQRTFVMCGCRMNDEEPNDDDIMVSFTDLQFDPKEENVPDNLNMSERLVFYSKSYDYEIQKLRDVAKERHELFVKQVTTMKESVDLRIVELKSELLKEVQKMEQNYILLYGKVDVITTAITKLVEFNSEYTNKLEAKSEKDTQMFEKMEEFLSSIKESLSKSNIKSEIAPILDLVLCLPTNAPHAMQVSHGGEKRIGGVGSSKDSDKEKGVLVEKVISTQILTSLPMSLTTNF
ncbi:unnamed protein product [Lactuca saligna]|uniref:Uncharacterized protein n=1 Tax=Lactuca saligna TaxID=75948 RepID=A0AA36EAU3_LACSI|nr:unnamed protein product [Lactuca saligna]